VCVVDARNQQKIEYIVHACQCKRNTLDLRAASAVVTDVTEASWRRPATLSFSLGLISNRDVSVVLVSEFSVVLLPVCFAK
jgi:hypothetical protein